jgi:hypothetical protein
VPPLKAAKRKKYTEQAFSEYCAIFFPFKNKKIGCL